jgi:hypothetical protein
MTQMNKLIISSIALGLVVSFIIIRVAIYLSTGV